MNRPGGPMPDEAELIATFVAWQNDRAVFTQEDVELLRVLAHHSTHSSVMYMNPGDAERFASLAARIAALLPHDSGPSPA